MTLRMSVRTWPSIVVVALAFSAGGCGESGGDSAVQDQTNQTTTTAATTNVAAERKAIAKLMRELREQYNAASGDGFCSRLTAGGQQEVRRMSATTFAALGVKGCEAFIVAFVRQMTSNGGLRERPVRIRSIKVKGDKASVTMKGGLAGIRSTADFKLAKINGVWKLADPVSGLETRRIQ